MNIDKGIPIPESVKKAGVYMELARRMSPGDSVLLPTRNAANILATNIRKIGGRATQRQVDGGFRVWRTL